MSTLKVNNIQNANGTSAIAIDSSGVATFSKTLVPSSSMMYRNLIINGDMRIAQRGTSFSSLTSSQYCLDRFSNDIGGGGAITVAQSSTAPSNFINSMSCTVATADSSIASGDAYRFTQPIEGLNTAHLGWGTANAKTVTLSFWVRSSVTGIYGIGIQNSAETENYVSEYTINSANTWEQKTITIAGPTSGTWLTTNGVGLSIRWDLGSGTNYNGTANTWQTTASKLYRTSSCVNWIATSGATFYITGVQLEVGDAATPFEHRPYDAELARCQRYYYTISQAIDGSAYVTQVCGNGTAAAQGLIPFPVEMRTSPTVSQSGLSLAGNVGSPAISNFNSYYTSTICRKTARLDWNASGMTGGVVNGIVGATAANSYIAFSAEL